MIDARLAAVIDALLDATPEPPEGAAEPSDVLDLVETIVAQRAPLLDELRALLGAATLPQPRLRTLRELDRRTSAWVLAAARARARVGEQLAAMHADPASLSP